MRYRVYIAPKISHAQMTCLAPLPKGEQYTCGFVSHERVAGGWKCSHCGHVREHPFGSKEVHLEAVLQHACDDFNVYHNEHGMEFWEAVNAACFKWGVKGDDLQYALSQRSALARAKGQATAEQALPYKD